MQADPDDHPLSPRRTLHPTLRRVLLWMAGLTVLFVLALGAYVAALVASSPSVEALRDVRSARPSVIMSADGKQLGLFRREKQEHVTLAQISPHVIDALISTEDHRFRDHGGVDVRRTVGAMFNTLKGDLQGGSTLTQQLARNMFPEEIGRSRSLHRKLKEVITAMRIERVYSKDEILETYLNTVPFFYNVVGIEMAARTYWGTSAKSLNELQSATLVGMLKGTQYYNPVRHPERALKRRNLVLTQMQRRGHLDEATLKALSAQPLNVTLQHQPENDGLAPHFVAQVRKVLLEWAETQDVDLYADGLVIETTLDAALQEAAVDAVKVQANALQQVADTEWGQSGMRMASLRKVSDKRAAEPFGHFWKQRPELLADFVRDSAEYRKAVEGGAAPEAALKAVMADDDAISRVKRQRSRLEAGFVAMDPATGEVKAWVGSRGFDEDQYDHVAQAERQPGSTFKPFVYGAALEAGLGPNRTFTDGPVEIPLGDGRFWRPTDMTGTSGQQMTLRDGLTFSKNTITAQVMQEVGVNRTVALAKSLGVDHSKLEPVPSLSLGTSPVTLLEMVNAYASIAKLGERHTPVLVRRIVNREGRALATFGDSGRRGMSTDSAIELIDMMRGVVARGTGTMVRTRFGVTGDVAGKTGTTQNNTDGWFILMHPQLVGGAWVGFNDTRVTMRSNYWGQGGHNAIMIVGDFFRSALKDGKIDTKATFPPSRHPVASPVPLYPSDWAEDGGGERDGGWLDGDDGRPRPPPVNAVEPDASAPSDGAPSDGASGPKTSMELDALLRLENARPMAAQ